MANGLPKASIERTMSQMAGGEWLATNWVAITGPPHSGKSSMCSALASRGFTVVRDASREIIASLLSNGHAIADIRRDQSALQRAIVIKMLQDADATSPNTLAFFDYALPDNIAFWQQEGLDVTPWVMASATKYRYRQVFYLEPLPYRDDEVRTEGASYAQSIGRRQLATYSDMGYHVERIAVAPLEARLAYILQALDSPHA